MKWFSFLLILGALWLAGEVLPARADETGSITGKDLVEVIKLVVRSDKGDQLSDMEKGRVQIMVAYLKGFTDGMHPMEELFPQGPVLIPQKVTMGEFAKCLDEYMTEHPDSLKEPSALVLYNCAFAYYRNPRFSPELMPRSVPLPPPPGAAAEAPK